MWTAPGVPVTRAESNLGRFWGAKFAGGRVGVQLLALS
jgi:hypothetical protein